MGGKPQYLTLQESEEISQQILKQRSQDKAWLHYADKLRAASQRLASAVKSAPHLRPVD
jgi:hypothetical protein